MTRNLFFFSIIILFVFFFSNNTYFLSVIEKVTVTLRNSDNTVAAITQIEVSEYHFPLKGAKAS